MSFFPEMDPLCAKCGYQDDAGGKDDYDAILLYIHKLGVATVIGLTCITSPELITLAQKRRYCI